MDRHSIIGLVFGSLAILSYFMFFLPWMYPPEERSHRPAGKPTAPRHAAADGPRQASVPPAATPAVGGAPKVLEILPTTGVQPVDNIVIENEYIKTVWTNKGATLVNATLKKYKDYSGNALRLFLPSDSAPRTLAINEILGKYDLSNRVFQVKEATPERISFQTSLENELRLTKTITLHKEKNYCVDVEILLENTANKEIPLRYSIVSASQIWPEGTPSLDTASVVGVSLGTKTKLILKTLGDLEGAPERNESHGIIWAGGADKYFASVLKPSTPDLIYGVTSREIADGRTKPGKNIEVVVETNNFTLLPGGSEKHQFLLFLGPKKEEVLKEYGLVQLLNFGMFTPVSKGLLRILNALYSVIPNYGLDIIIMTIVVKALLFPLTRKSQMSMFKMQKLQPQIKQLQEKYKNDKQRQGQEQMALFKRHGVNPMSGCLPIVLQLPIFYALFRTLQLSFEMRQAPFGLWIHDLARPDMLYTLTDPLPFLGSHINALPIIMAAASIVQMKMMPSNPDPKMQQQQQLMKFMPIMFAFILYHMPSGLLLYWTTSTILSVGEQVLIRRMVARLK